MTLALGTPVAPLSCERRHWSIWQRGMTPADFRAARKALGLTQHGLAEALRMGKHGWQTISRWERDGGTVPGAAQVAVELMLSSKR